MPIRMSRDTTPSRSWSTSTCCDGVGERGRKAETSVVIVVRAMIAPHATRNTSHAPIAQRKRTGFTGLKKRSKLVRCDRHHRAVTVGLGDLDRAYRAAAPVEADLAHHPLHGGLGRLQGE